MQSFSRRGFSLTAGSLIGFGMPSTLLANTSSETDLTNIRASGAKGDGKTDDTAAIRNAILKAKTGRILFPRGDYRITQTIEIPLSTAGPLCLDGSGGGRVIMSGAGVAFRFVGSHTGTADPASVKNVVWEKERMPTVLGLEITGTNPEADGIEFYQTMMPTLIGVQLRSLRNAVRLSKRNRNVLLDSCHIYQCSGIGVYFDKVNLHQTIIYGCHISYCKQGGIKIIGSEIRNLHITGNDIEYNYDLKRPESADVWIDVREGSVREGSIVSNTIQAKVSPGGANVRMIGSATGNKVGLWTIAGNHISNQMVNIHLTNCRGVVLSDNSVVLGRERSIILDGCRHIVVGPHSLDHNPDYKGDTVDGISLKNCDGCTIQGVILEGASAGNKREGGSIEVYNSRETSILGCSIFEPTHRGIYVKNGRNTMIANCTIVDRSAKPTFISGIEVQGQSPGSLIHSNIVDKGSAGTIVAPRVRVEGNEPAAK